MNQFTMINCWCCWSQESKWQQTQVMSCPDQGAGALPHLRIQRHEVQLRLVQAVVPEVPDPAEVQLRWRDHRVDPVKVWSEQVCQCPGPPDIRTVSDQEGGSLIQSIFRLGAQVDLSFKQFTFYLIFKRLFSLKCQMSFDCKLFNHFK